MKHIYFWDRIKLILCAVGIVIGAVTARSQNTFNVPVIFDTGTTITITPGVPLYGTWDFSGATSVVGVPPPTISLTGNVTGSGTTSIVTTIAAIPDLVSAPGSILSSNISAPTAPASNKIKWYSDSTDKRFHDRNDTGATGTTVVANTGTTNQFVTGVSTSGVITTAQPNFSNLTGTAIVATEIAFSAKPGSPATGTMVNFSDSNTNTWGATVAGGGSNHVLARYNGTNWTVVGK